MSVSFSIFDHVKFVPTFLGRPNIDMYCSKNRDTLLFRTHTVKSGWYNKFCHKIQAFSCLWLKRGGRTIKNWRQTVENSEKWLFFGQNKNFPCFEPKMGTNEKKTPRRVRGQKIRAFTLKITMTYAYSVDRGRSDESNGASSESLGGAVLEYEVFFQTKVVFDPKIVWQDYWRPILSRKGYRKIFDIKYTCFPVYHFNRGVKPSKIDIERSNTNWLWCGEGEVKNLKTLKNSTTFTL